MPIEYEIDTARRLVRVRGVGVLTDQDVFGYQNKCWSRPEVAGFDELIDMTDVEHIAVPSVDRVVHLARLSADMDVEGVTSKLAIIAPGDRAFGLGRMFQAHRQMEGSGMKHVGVFRTRADALAFLGLES